MASGYMPLFINVKIYFQPPPPNLSIPQITILCATFISPFNLFLTAGCPLYVSLPSRSGQASSEFLLLRLVKKLGVAACLFTPFLWASCFLPEFPLSSGQQSLIYKNAPHDLSALYSSDSLRPLKFLFPSSFSSGNPQPWIWGHAKCRIWENVPQCE